MMSSDERARWDDRYSSGDYVPSKEPSLLVEKVAGYLDSGRALVLACGTGRNALYLASQGFTVEAVDISPVAIEMARAEADRRGLELSWRIADIDELRPNGGGYDLITMIRYSNREIWPRLVPALSVNGWLVMEQHMRTRHPVAGPSDQFRISPGELLEAFPRLRVIEYFEEYRRSETSGMMISLAGLLACKGDPGW